jgi:hypothetical protein
MSITITISSENPRSIRALEIAAGAASWIKCRTHDGRKLYAVPSRSTAGLYHLVDLPSGECAWLRPEHHRRDRGRDPRHTMPLPPCMPPLRYVYVLELVCSLCSRTVASVALRSPTARLVLLRPVRCQVCSGVTIAGESPQRHQLPEAPAPLAGGDRSPIVAGERRWRAAQRLSWTEITAIVRSDVDDRPLIRLALLENLARTDLDPLEEAMATARFRVWQELVQAGKLTLSAA